MKINVSKKGNPSITKPETAEEEILRRVAVCLLKILKNEYGELVRRPRPGEEPLRLDFVVEQMQKRNPRIPEKDPTVNLEDLREQLQNYAKGLDPFKRRFGEGGSVRSWWKQVRKDSIEEAGILSVHIQFFNSNTALTILIYRR